MDKVEEELRETKKALLDFALEPTKDNYIKLLKESIDILNATLTIGCGLFDIRLSDAYNLALEKINRTELIINMSDKEKDPVSEYERIRRELKWLL